ncbi:MAG: zeta toxin family protein [Planctomycetes bacterium]|nr:zeta toxin family protein [Planctomycetota bacterium]
MPNVILIGGPNGAGKSTIAPDILASMLLHPVFVNADTIAEGIGAPDHRETAMQAGRIMLRRLEELARQQADFAFETTLASRTFAPWLRKLQRGGYFVHLLFVWLPDAELALERVARRRALGGHGVPEPLVRRRFVRGLRNLHGLYLPVADTWTVYDNSRSAGPRLVARGGKRQHEHVADEPTWTRIRSHAP